MNVSHLNDLKTNERPQQLPAKPIVFFDGVCGMCNYTVDFLMRHDLREQLTFAPLQGETAKTVLPVSDRDDLNSMVFSDRGRTYRRSAAAVRILNRLGGVWRLLAWGLWIVPLPVRNLVYRWIAKNRYRWFGKKESCRMPSESERNRLLP